MDSERIELPDFPAFSLRISARARRISLNISPEEGLELLIPSPRYRRKALEFLYSQRAWIEKKLAELPALNPKAPEQVLILPDKIQLLGIQQEWGVRYQEAARARFSILEPQQLLIQARSGDFKQHQSVLLRWLKYQAVLHIKPLLDELSAQTQLNYTALSFKRQKSRWGSCTREHKINLNYQLLFFPPAWLRYILLHELCHIRHFNHSARFWALLEKFEPEYRRLRVEMREGARRLLPAWVCE